MYLTHIAVSIVTHRSLGDITILLNIAIPFFIQLQYWEPFQVIEIEISENRNLKNISRLKKTPLSESQKFHGNEIRTVFSAFGSEKQKQTSSEVHTHNANGFAIYCDACRRVHSRGHRLSSNHAWMKNITVLSKITIYVWQYIVDEKTLYLLSWNPSRLVSNHTK